MESYILATVIFISFLLGFFLMFGFMAHFYKERDDRQETQFSSIRPGYYESTRKRIEQEYERTEQIRKEQTENDYIPKEYPNDPIIEDDDMDANECDSEIKEDNDNFLARRIPSKKSSFIQCINSMKSERTYEDKLKDDKKNENQAYNILKRRMDSKKMDGVCEEKQKEELLSDTTDVSKNDILHEMDDDTTEEEDNTTVCEDTSEDNITEEDIIEE